MSSVSVTLPALGESVTEGTVTRWLKQVGDSVEADEPLLEVSTDKVDTEVPSPAAGTLLSITAQEDDSVEVGGELGVIGDSADPPGDSGDAAPDDAAPNGGASNGQAPDDAAPDDGGADSSAGTGAGPADSGHSVSSEVPGGQSGSLPADEADPSGEAGDSDDDRRREQAGSGSAGGSGSGTSVTLPALGESVTEGTVTRWLKQVGDSVEADEPLLEVSTDKVDTEVPSPVAGTLLSITAQEDDTVEVGGELGVIGSPDAAGSSGDGDGSGGGADTGADGTTAQQPSERAPERQAGSDADRAPSPAPAEPEPPAEPVRPVGTDSGGGRPTGSGASGGSGGDSGPDAATSGARSGDAGSASPYVTPLVRRLAAENEVDLTSVTGSGVGGRIRKQDVLDAAEAARRAAREAEQAQPAATAGTSGTPDGDRSGGTGSGSASRPPAPASPLRGTTEKMSRLRRVIATRMVESLQTSAQLTTVVEVDVTAVARLRQRAKAGFEQREGVKLSFLPFFALATVEALKAMPRLNATLDSERGEITYAAGEHLGIAVDTERGLLVPVVTDAGDLNLAGLARRIADLATRTRTNALSPDELAGGTFTLTNTGSRGALFDTPILNQPQVGILGTGAVVKRPVVVDAPGIGETIAVRSMVYLALTYDHRLVDGADAARFLVAIRQRLEEGAFEAEVGL